jgi:peptidoglycan hydrolase CwlO-like protein
VSKMMWIVLAAVVGIGLAILIGVTGSATADSPAEAQQSLCTSLGSLNAATNDLESLDPQTASKSDYQAAVSDVDDAWNDVTSDAQDVKTAATSALNGAWNEFTQAVQSIRATHR